MLNFAVAMFFKKGLAFLLLTLSLIWYGGYFAAQTVRAAAPTPTPTRANLELTITAPSGGEALQGSVAIMGTARAVNLASIEVSFAYQTDSTRTWFLISQSSQSVEQGSLSNWDTTTISDGMYRLRVQMFLKDGRVLESVVDGLRVRNYSPVETSTPAPENESTIAPRATATFTSTPLPDLILPERTPLPQATNPVQVNLLNLAQSAAAGILWVIGALVVGGFYLGLKSLFRRR